MRTLLVNHLYYHSHSLRNDQNIGEDDRSINKAFIALNGLEGYGRCDFRCAAAFEEVAATLCLVVLGEVSASYYINLSAMQLV